MKVRTRIINKEIETQSLKYAKEGDAGIDLTATSLEVDDCGNYVYGTNRAFEIPKGYVGLLFPRSSISKTKQHQTNSVGVVDSGYRGEVMIKMKPSMTYPNSDNSSPYYKVGERVGQLIILPYPEIEFEEADELSDSERGEGGYGSTGK